MGQTADQLRQEIEMKRGDAASKIDEIESRVSDTAQMARSTVEQAKETVTDTVEEVKGTVTDTVEQVKSSVQNFDYQQQIQERPLAVLGAALAGGFLLGGLLGGGDKQQGGGQGQYQPYGGYAGGRASGLRGAMQSSGLDSQISAIGGTLMGIVSERVRSTVEQNFPEFNEKLRQHSEQQQSSRSSGYGQRQASWLDASSSRQGVASGSSATTDRPVSGMAGAGTGAGAGTASSMGSRSGSAAETDASGRTVSYYGSGTGSEAGAQG